MHAAGVRGQRRTTIELPGVTDVSPVGSGLLWATTGAGPGETDPQNDTGQALHRIAGGKTSEVVNLFAFEERANPDGNDPHDSNPFDVEALSGNAALVVDAGGNDLLRVNKRGDVDVLATFPDQLVSTENIKDLAGCPDGPANFCGLPPMLPAEAVPTSVAIVPGDYYVGELTGFPRRPACRGSGASLRRPRALSADRRALTVSWYSTAGSRRSSTCASARTARCTSSSSTRQLGGR